MDSPVSGDRLPDETIYTMSLNDYFIYFGSLATDGNARRIPSGK